jgi:hypothetical protein
MHNWYVRISSKRIFLGSDHIMRYRANTATKTNSPILYASRISTWNLSRVAILHLQVQTAERYSHSVATWKAGIFPLSYAWSCFWWQRAVPAVLQQRFQYERASTGLVSRTAQNAQFFALAENEKRMKNHPFWRFADRVEICLSHSERAMLPGLDSQALAALGAARIQDIAATTGRHASAKAVGAFATHYGRLISTFHEDLVIQQGWFGMLHSGRLMRDHKGRSKNIQHQYKVQGTLN